jgi:hypothetical protein
MKLRSPMLAQDHAQMIWILLEQLYLDSATKQPAENYATLGQHDKRTVLKDFAKAQAVTSKRWAQILKDLPAAEC